jgi:cbb3-type cytochrome oxidase subunit 3
MIRKMTTTTLKRASVAIAALLSPSALCAQGCAMCYQSAASSGPRFIQALRHGILIMFFPPIIFMAAIVYSAYRKRNQFNFSGEAAAEGGFDEDTLPAWSLEDETYLRKLVEDET